MAQYTFFYRFEPLGIDFSSAKEIKQYNSELTSFSCLENQLNKLKFAYDNATKERADIAIDVLPDLSGVAELQVYHKIKFKLFSHKLKLNCFSICISKYNTKNELSLFFYETENFDEVKQILKDFIENKTLPELSGWKTTFIG